MNGFEINFRKTGFIKISVHIFFAFRGSKQVFFVQWLLDPFKFKVFQLISSQCSQTNESSAYFMALLRGVKWSKVKGTLDFQSRISPFLIQYKGHKILVGNFNLDCFEQRHYKHIDLYLRSLIVQALWKWNRADSDILINFIVLLFRIFAA